MKTSDSLTLAMLSLQNTPQGVEYCELNRSEPGSLSATKNHQGGLADAEDESSGAQIICVSGSEKCKNAQDLPTPSQPNVRCSVSETKRWSKENFQSHRR